MQKKFYRTMIKSRGIPPGAIARWNGGSFLDTSGSANVYDGTPSANPPTLTTGINGETNGAFNFVSANLQKIDFGSITDIKNVEKISISAWLKKTTGNFLTLGDLVASATEGSSINYSSSNIIFGICRNGLTSSVQVNGTSNLGLWTHICLIFDGSQQPFPVSMYIDSVLGGVSPGPLLTANNADPFTMGFIFNNVYSDGQIAQTLVYDRVLTQADVDQIFAQKTV